MNDLTRLQGKRLKEIRKILGKTQESFSEWLLDHGATGNYGEPYKQKTIAAWEAGRRKVPDDIKKIISDTVTINDQKVQYAYLNGDTDFITKSVDSIIKNSKEILNTNNLPDSAEWTRASSDDIKQMEENPVNRFADILFNKLLPLYGCERTDFFDQIRFNYTMYVEIQKLIEEFRKNEKNGE